MQRLDHSKTYLVKGQTLESLINIANAVANIEGRDGILVDITDNNIVIKLGGQDQDGGLETVEGLPAGYTFEEFTICDSGSSATRWWPTWTSDPS